MATYRVKSDGNYHNIDADTVGLSDDKLKFFRTIEGVEDKMELIALFRTWDHFEKVV